MAIKKIQINAPSWDTILNEKFLDLPYCKDKHMILWGSRASSKSYAAAEILVDRAVKWKGFNCVCIREEVSKNTDSTFKLLIECIKRNNLESLFSWTYSPNLRIKCINGNEFIFRGMNDIDNIKGLVEYSCAWFEEEVPFSEFDFDTVSLTLRSNTTPFTQIIYTINPTLADFKNHWFWKRWFEGENDLSFRKEFRMEVEDIDGNVEEIVEYATIHHSCYLDNKWCPKDTYKSLQLMKLKDPYAYATQALGRWSEKTPKSRFWKLFSLKDNSVPFNRYNPNIPLWFSFDFNKNPGMHVGIYQIEGKTVRQINELSLKNPRNRTEDACEHLIRLYNEHESGVYITGDPNGYKEDSSTEKGFNNFALVFNMLNKFSPSDKTIRKAPPIAKSAEWINEIFFGKIGGIEVIIPEDCHETIADLLNAQEAPDGTMLKPKVKDKEEGTTYERWGHHSDLFRYLMVSAFPTEFDRYKDPNSGFNPIIVPRIRRNRF